MKRSWRHTLVTTTATAVLSFTAACSAEEDAATASDMAATATESAQGANKMAGEQLAMANDVASDASEMADDMSATAEDAASDMATKADEAADDMAAAAEGVADDMAAGADKAADEANVMVAQASDVASDADMAADASGAKTVEVQMLNKHPDDPKQRMVFYPNLVVVKPGDTVKFVSADKGHNSATTNGMVPDGGEEWKGRISQDVEVTFETPGFYGYNCTPHKSQGMVGLVIVEGDGMTDNLAEAQKVRQFGKSKQVWDGIWAEAEEKGYLN